MKEENLEKRIDEKAAAFEGWYARLPLVVRALGDVICLGLTVYIVAWLCSVFGLFGLSSPNAWNLSTWGYILGACFLVGLVYERVMSKRKA